MKPGVKNGDVRRGANEMTGSANHVNRGRSVEWRKRDKSLQLCQDRIVDSRRLEEVWATMNDAVPDGNYPLPPGCHPRRQIGKRALNRHVVIRTSVPVADAFDDAGSR